jgi:hypothetical protein
VATDRTVPLAGTTHSMLAFYIDYSDERVCVELPLRAIPPSYNDAHVTLEGVTAVNIPYVFEVSYQDKILLPPSIPGDQFAQNEYEWRVRYRDLATNATSRFVLPGADMSLLAPSSDQLDILTPGSPGNTLATWINTYVASPQGNAMQVISIEVN